MPDGVQDAILNNMSGYETYPDIRYTALREAVAGKERVQAERILCGNGASELIMAVVRAEKPYKCAVAAPSFRGMNALSVRMVQKLNITNLMKEWIWLCRCMQSA